MEAFINFINGVLYMGIGTLVVLLAVETKRLKQYNKELKERDNNGNNVKLNKNM